MAKKKPKSKNSKQSTVSKQSSNSVNDSTEDEVIVAALSSSTHQSVLMKVCRLCETRDGPFLNIFDTENTTAKKIDELMPFRITENDDLPHKICFRCSAKIEELYEFIQKCIKTQKNLESTFGKKGPLVMKIKTRTLWEEKLNKTNLSNDEICDALIKKAIEGFKDLTPLPSEEEKTTNKKTKTIVTNENESNDENDEMSLKQVKLSIEKCDERRSSRSNKSEPLLEGLEIPKKCKPNPSKKPPKPAEEKLNTEEKIEKAIPEKVDIDTEAKEVKKANDPKKPFNIMDHVNTIKVHGVGVLFQCKLCNRNFLIKELIESHGCAKNHGPKDNIPQNVPTVPEPPKPITVKYITMDKDFKKPDLNKKAEKKIIENKEITIKPVEPEVKPKPKIGPASKVKRDREAPVVPQETPPNVTMDTKTDITTPMVTFPTMPSLNSRYKLVPGPNNTFTLVEEQSGNVVQSKPVPVPAVPVPPLVPVQYKKQKTVLEEEPSKCTKIIDIEDNMPITQPVQKEQPYPVGLFQTVPHHSSVYPAMAQPPAFTTPAMKKQSYTIVQTGNPSKLLISTKPQPVTEEVVKKKSKKHKIESKEPYKVTLEENPIPKNGSFFNFVNLDPLLQPSYVLPTDNIIQESRISTSTPGAKTAIENKYTCNMCNEKFNREKKLLAHIQSHYNQMDEEDSKRAENVPRKKSKKS